MNRDSLWRAPGMRPLALVSVLGFTSFFLTLASLAVWAVHGGTSRGAAGVVVATMLASTVVFQTVIPMLERRWGLVVVLGAGLVALGAPAPLYAFSGKLGWLVFISVARGAGFASFTVLCGMLIARISAPENHREAVGIYGLSVALPNLAAVPAGVALTSSGHFAWVAWLAVSPVLGLPVLRRLQAAPGPDTPRHERRTVGSIRRAVRASLGPSVVLAAVTAAGGGVVTFLPLDRPHGAVAPLALLVVGVSVALGRWRAAAWWHRTGPQLLICALTGAAAGLTVIAAALHRWPGTGSATVIVVGAGVFGMGYGVTQNLTLVAAFDRARTEHAITASMVWNVAFDAGTAVGAYGVGAVADTGIGLPWTYLVTAGLVALSIPIAARTCSPADHPARWSA